MDILLRAALDGEGGSVPTSSAPQTPSPPSTSGAMPSASPSALVPVFSFTPPSSSQAPLPSPASSSNGPPLLMTTNFLSSSPSSSSSRSVAGVASQSGLVVSLTLSNPGPIRRRHYRMIRRNQQQPQGSVRVEEGMLHPFHRH